MRASDRITRAPRTGVKLSVLDSRSLPLSSIFLEAVTNWGPVHSAHVLGWLWGDLAIMERLRNTWIERLSSRFRDLHPRCLTISLRINQQGRITGTISHSDGHAIAPRVSSPAGSSRRSILARNAVCGPEHHVEPLVRNRFPAVIADPKLLLPSRSRAASISLTLRQSIQCWRRETGHAIREPELPPRYRQE